jgi:hypothetical protein
MFDTVRRHPLLVLSQVARDPIDALTAIQDQILSRFEPGTGSSYVANPNWETELQNLLGIRPEIVVEGFWPLWNKVVESLQARGMKVGPLSFHGWNDGDAGFVRAIWCLIRHSRPGIVVETGVAHGMTSRFILEALERNGTSKLWSVDLPPFNPVSRQEVGVAVDDPGLRRRWTYIAGTSRRKLPALLSQLQQIDLFIHDSLHSKRNVMFELEQAWKHLKPGGVIVVDDIDINYGFRAFTALHPECPSFVCPAEPIRPDERRFNQKGVFGIICKHVAQRADFRDDEVADHPL